MSIGPVTFSLPKTTGTHGDVLAAVGLADLLQAATETVVRLSDEGTFIAVYLAETVLWDSLPATAGYPFLKVSITAKVPGGVTEYVDYPAERERAARYYQARKAARRVDEDTLALVEEDRPRPDWRLWQVLNTLQGDETTNKVHLRIAQTRPEKLRGEVLEALHRLAAGKPTHSDWPATGVQLFSPNAAKGYSRLKPDSTGRNDKTKEQWVDPFVEWLKYRGYFRIACPFFEGKRGENIHLLCPVPGDIAVRALEDISGRLNRIGVYGGPPKMDALAVLRLAALLIRHSEEYAEDPLTRIPHLSVAGKSPGKIISELLVTHYQSLGQSRAISAMFRLAVPSWFDIYSDEDAHEWLAILQEHEAVIRGLHDDRSDEIGLLIRYRHFLERRGESAGREFVEFLEHYGPFLLRAREQRRRPRAFQTDRVRRIIVANDARLAEILDNPGFAAVASAVRRSTVSAQAQKAMGIQDYREIRYNLLHDLRRKRSLPGTEFLESISEFISLYNAENARRRELKLRAPSNVTTEELHAFARLMDRYGAAVVGALLCAYGSCREPREPEISTAASEEEDESNAPVDVTESSE
ncbi:MAG: hypothetical protein RDU89_11490 [bacterium]|nr:hypothetical protein [bacterium]